MSFCVSLISVVSQVLSFFTMDSDQGAGPFDQGLGPDHPAAERTGQSSAPEDRGDVNMIANVFRQFTGLLQGRRTPEISYSAAKKHGAFEFSTVRDSLDAYRWVERMERVFVHLQVPEDRKVGLASEFLEDEPQYWWVEVSGGEHGRFAWADFKRMFNDRYFSPSHRIKIQDEFLNLRKGNMSVLEFQQKFLSLAHHVPHLIDSEDTKIYRFIQALGWSLYREDGGSGLRQLQRCFCSCCPYRKHEEVPWIRYSWTGSSQAF